MATKREVYCTNTDARPNVSSANDKRRRIHSENRVINHSPEMSFVYNYTSHQ